MSIRQPWKLRNYTFWMVENFIAVSNTFEHQPNVIYFQISIRKISQMNTSIYLEFQLWKMQLFQFGFENCAFGERRREEM